MTGKVINQIMDYLEIWRVHGQWHKDVSGRIPILIEAANIIYSDNRLSNWRFAPGRNRGKDKNPMYCAFATTPFEGDDWFILRLRKRENKFSIGFCPDYGTQESKRADYQPVTTRRKEIQEDIKSIQIKKPMMLNDIPFPVADSKGRPHAYKGFERECKVKDAKSLSNEFITTVLEWEKLFKLIL